MYTNAGIQLYQDTTISSNLTINGNLGSSMKIPLDIKNSTIHTKFWTLASFHQGIANSGSWLQFSRDGTSNTWQAGMSSDDSYVIRASDSTNRLSVYPNGDTTIAGNLEITKVLTLKEIPGVSDTSPLTITNESPGGSTGVVYQSTSPGQDFMIAYVTAQSSVAREEGVNLGGASNCVIKSGSNGLTLKTTGDAVISGYLDVGVGASVTSIKAYVNHVRHQRNVEIETRWNSQGVIHSNTTNPDGLLLIATKDELYLYCGFNTIYVCNKHNSKCFR